jgi:hypothetical protein
MRQPTDSPVLNAAVYFLLGELITGAFMVNLCLLRVLRAIW